MIHEIDRNVSTLESRTKLSIRNRMNLSDTANELKNNNSFFKRKISMNEETNELTSKGLHVSEKFRKYKYRDV